MAKRQNGVKRKGKNGQKKYGRNQRKAAAKGNPISLFVRDRITAAQYFQMTHQK